MHEDYEEKWIKYALYFIMEIFLKTITMNNKYKVIKMESNFIRKNSHFSRLCTWISWSTILTGDLFTLLSSVPETDWGREGESKEEEWKGVEPKTLVIEWLGINKCWSSLLLLISLVHHY